MLYTKMCTTTFIMWRETRMKRLICICWAMVLLLTGCGGDRKNSMTLSKEKQLEKNSEFYNSICFEGENIEPWNYVQTDDEIKLWVDGENQYLDAFFKNASERVKLFNENHTDYFKDIDKIYIGYYLAGTDAVYAANYDESFCEAFGISKDDISNKMDLNFIRIDTGLFQLNSSNGKYNYPMVWLDINVAADEDFSNYDLSVFDEFEAPEYLMISLFVGGKSDTSNSDKLLKRLQEKFPDTQVIIR